MNQAIKYEIFKMSIPILGVIYILNRVLPSDRISINWEPTWWDNAGSKGFNVLRLMMVYQAICFATLKYITTL